LKERVVAFRIPAIHGVRLEKRAEDIRVVNVTSGNMLARKVIMDFLDGKLIYTNAHDHQLDPVVALSQQA
jgi:hypothetical protein